ncbi:MAG TPA: chemotaxis protein CheW [Gaiellaceae bacterium]|nr:chemotaxis protein CheW [Gaiellaceae bacterium]
MSGVHVRVGLGDETYALPVGNVTETATADGLAPLPGSPPSVVGVCNLRGELLPVFDLAGVLGLPRSGNGERMVVLEHSKHRAGLVVDAVHDVGPLGGPTEEVESDLLEGAVLDDGALVGIVDVARLFDRLAREAP